MKKACFILAALFLCLSPVLASAAEQVKLKYVRTIYTDADGGKLFYPEGVTAAGGQVFIADSGNRRVLRFINKDGMVSPDAVFPMDYTMDSFSLRKNEQSFLDAIKDDEKLATGISLYVRSGGKVTSRDPSLVSEQIVMVRSMGIQGFCLFCYDYLSDAILDMLRQGPLVEPSTPAFRLR